MQLPCNPEAERTILGSIILNNQLIYEAQSELTIEDFYTTSNALIYTTMLELAYENAPIDPQTITNKIGDFGKKVGGLSYITNLTYGVPFSTNISYYSKILRDKTIKRQLLKSVNTIASTIQQDIEPAGEILSTLDASIEPLRSSSGVAGEFRSYVDVATDVHQKIQDLRDGKDIAIPSGLSSLDMAMKGGGRPGELHIWAAKTGQGKSVLAKQIAQNVASRGDAVAIVTAEMSDYEVFFRQLSPEAQVPAWHVQPGISSDKLDALEQAIVKVANLPIFINDKSTSIFDIVSSVKLLKKQHDIKVLIVDYLQLLSAISSDKNFRFITNRAQEMSLCSRMLKQIAKELGIWVIALAQFNRQANQKDETTGESKPEIYHLAESSGLEKDADLVGIIDLEEYKQGQPLRKATLRIGKYRNGPAFNLPYTFNGDYLIFVERSIESVVHSKDNQTKDLYVSETDF